MPRARIKKPYKDHGDDDLDKEFPDPPFTESTVREIEEEMKRIDDQKTKGLWPKSLSSITRRDMWLVKKGAGRIHPTGGFTIRSSHAYIKFSEMWNKYTEWHAKKDFAEGKRLQSLDEIFQMGKIIKSVAPGPVVKRSVGDVGELTVPL